MFCLTLDIGVEMLHSQLDVTIWNSGEKAGLEIFIWEASGDQWYLKKCCWLRLPRG